MFLYGITVSLIVFILVVDDRKIDLLHKEIDELKEIIEKQ